MLTLWLVMRELSMAEQRYWAVVEVDAGVSVAEVVWAIRGEPRELGSARCAVGFLRASVVANRAG